MFSRFKLLQGGVSYLLLSSGAQHRVSHSLSLFLFLYLLDPIDRGATTTAVDDSRSSAGDNSDDEFTAHCCTGVARALHGLTRCQHCYARRTLQISNLNDHQHVRWRRVPHVSGSEKGVGRRCYKSCRADKFNAWNYLYELLWLLRIDCIRKEWFCWNI